MNKNTTDPTSPFPREKLENVIKTVKLPDRDTLEINTRTITGKIPWMLGLKILDFSETKAFVLRNKLILGRGIPPNTENPYLNLSSYRANAQGVSRQHACIYVHQASLAIQDLGSTNGTYLNGYRLESYVDIPLRNDDIIELGKLRLQVVFITREG